MPPPPPPPCYQTQRTRTTDEINENVFKNRDEKRFKSAFLFSTSRPAHPDKSTLLDLLSGRCAAGRSEGRVLFEGRTLFTADQRVSSFFLSSSQEELLATPSRAVCACVFLFIYLPQKSNVHQQITCYGNVLRGQERKRKKKEKKRGTRTSTYLCQPGPFHTHFTTQKAASSSTPPGLHERLPSFACPAPTLPCLTYPPQASRSERSFGYVRKGHNGFLPGLSSFDNLMFAAMLRIPESVEEQARRVVS